MAILIKGISMPKDGKLIDLTIMSDGTVSETWDLRSKKIGRATEVDEDECRPADRTGKWMVGDAFPHNVYCSNCFATYAQEKWEVWADGTLPRNYCPNCGSYNGGEE